MIDIEMIAEPLARAKRQQGTCEHGHAGVLVSSCFAGSKSHCTYYCSSCGITWDVPASSNDLKDFYGPILGANFVESRS